MNNILPFVGFLKIGIYWRLVEALLFFHSINTIIIRGSAVLPPKFCLLKSIYIVRSSYIPSYDSDLMDILPHSHIYDRSWDLF